MKDALTFLRHIRDAFDRILAYTQQGEDAFMQDTLVQDGVIRNLAVVGEASKNIPKSFPEAHAEIPWADMAGLRDVVVHRYADIDLRLVWYAVSKRIPGLYPKIEQLIDDLSEES